MLSQYLDINKQVNHLREQIDTPNEIFDVFRGSCESKHSNFLEYCADCSRGGPKFA